MKANDPYCKYCTNKDNCTKPECQEMLDWHTNQDDPMSYLTSLPGFLAAIITE